ncbi:Splicing factor [Tieghemiomyces parasiticus]|uniref:Splicing factor n=1 Tax=Tieghemiomyces parasiticus TaxID=78921 RepID=A0A9W8AC09_9FUNG|nr:Splicing factor [Tieghemiomyces parasiticus]
MLSSSGSDSDSDFSLIEDEPMGPGPMVEVDWSEDEGVNPSPALATAGSLAAPSPDSTPDASLTAQLDPTVAARLAQLDAELQANPYLYPQHVERITLLDEHHCTAALETACAAMHRVSGLPEDVWRRWLAVRTATCATAGDVDPVISLYTAAVDDYLSIPLWLAFLDFVRDALAAGTLDLARARTVCTAAERATVGHYSAGHLVFSAVRDLEQAHLESLTDLEAVRAQVVHLDALYLARLARPSAHLSDLFTDYSTFVSNYRPADYATALPEANRIYSRAMEQGRKREAFEAQLVATGDHLSVYHKYVYALRRHPAGTHPGEVRTLYERALAVHFLNPSLWQVCLDHELAADPPATDDAATLCDRAVRNCPWSGALWATYLRLDSLGHPAAPAPTDILARGLAYFKVAPQPDEVVVLLLADLAERRWRHRDTTDRGAAVLHVAFDEAQAHLRTICSAPVPDPYFRLERYQAEVAWRVLDDVAAARAIWQAIIDCHPTTAVVWLEYVDFCLRHESTDTTRRVLSGLVRRTLDWPEQIFARYLDFEQKYGTPREVQLAHAHVDQMRVTLEIRAERTAAEQAEQLVTEEGRQERRRQKDRDNKKKRRERARHSENAPEPATKRKLSPESGVGSAADEALSESEAHELPRPVPLTKRTRVMSPVRPETERTTPPNDRKADDLTTSGTNGDDSATRTVLVGNLSPAVREPDLRAWLADVGSVRNVHLVRDLTGTLKGYAYVEFCTPAMAARAAPSRDGKTLADRTVTVRPLAARGPDPRTVYVCNFPAGTTEAALRELFEPAGPIRQVRLPAAGRGKARRFAYVEFDDATAACRAVTTLDGQPWPGTTLALSVAISDTRRAKATPPAVVPKLRDPRVLVVGNLTPAVTPDQIREMFSSFGTLVDVRFPGGDNSRGFAFVEYSEAAAATRAIATLDGIPLDDQTLSVAIADPTAEPSGGRPPPAAHPAATAANPARTATVRLTNFARPLVLAEVRSLCAEYGDVTRVHVNKEGSKVFVTYATIAEADRAVAGLHDRWVKGRPLKLQHVVPQASEEADATRSSAPLSSLTAPRALRRPTRKLDTSGLRTTPQPTVSSLAPIPSAQPQGKSNDDFRRLFLSTDPKK